MVISDANSLGVFFEFLSLRTADIRRLRPAWLTDEGLQLSFFCSLVVYGYMKLKRLSPANALFFKLLDSLLILCIAALKNMYSNRSDARNLGILPWIWINWIGGSSSQRVLDESFFFSASGNLFLAFLLA